MDLLSHPDKSLLLHLTEVANVAVDSIKRKKLNLLIDFDGKETDISELITDLVYFSAAFHDLGKATSFFQYYIQNLDEVHDKRKSHALLSALFVFFVSEKFLKPRDIDNELAQLLSIFTFSAVKRHHGRLNNLSDEILIEDEWRELLPELVENIDSESIQNLINVLISGYHLKIDWTDFVGFIKNETYNSRSEEHTSELQSH